MKYGALIPMVRHEIRRLGGVIDRERYGRHLVIYWSIGEAKRITVVPLSTSNWHMPNNVRAQVRRSAKGVHA